MEFPTCTKPSMGAANVSDIKATNREMLNALKTTFYLKARE